jgi:hypothetical protein
MSIVTINVTGGGAPEMLVRDMRKQLARILSKLTGTRTVSFSLTVFLGNDNVKS